MLVLQLILCAVIGYLLGNIQTGLLIGRLSNVDLRQHGSGSSGATNALRVLGQRQGLFTLLGDALKGVLAVCVGLIICGRRGGMAGALFVAVGHIWPVFFDFRGGKGVATAIGALFTLLPVHALIILAVGCAVIYLTKMVSLGSIAGAVAYLIAATITSLSGKDWFLFVFSLLMAALVLFAHRANIDRILKGTENKLGDSAFQKKA